VAIIENAGCKHTVWIRPRQSYEASTISDVIAWRWWIVKR
jgi:hypothetical protein